MPDTLPHFYEDPTDWEFFEYMDSLIVKNRGLERFEAKILVMRLHNCFHYIRQQEDRVKHWMDKAKETKEPAPNVYPKRAAGNNFAGD